MHEQSPKEVPTDPIYEPKTETTPSILDTAQYKKDLETVRLSDDVIAIGQEEIRIATSICNISDSVSPFDGNLLSETLLQEVGIKYLRLIPPDKDYYLTMLVTSDNQLVLMQNSRIQIIPDDLIGGLKNGESQLIKDDILKYSQNPTEDNLTLQISQWNFIICYPEKIKETPCLRGFANGFTYEASKEGVSETDKKRLINKAIEFRRKIIELEPDLSINYNKLGNLLYDTGEIEHIKEAEKIFRRETEIDPKKSSAYYNLGLAITIQNNILRLYDAISAFRKAIEFANDEDSELKLNSEEIIKELEKHEGEFNMYTILKDVLINQYVNRRLNGNISKDDNHHEQ